MRSGLRRSTRALCAAAAVFVTVAPAASGASGASVSDDTAIARDGMLVADDLPVGFEASPQSDTSHADNIRLARGIDGCGHYVALQKLVAARPEVTSPQFGDATRTVSNEVDVFVSDRAARAALVLYAKSSVVGCLERLFEKRARLDPNLRDSLDEVAVDLDRQEITGLGDDRVVYEGSVELTGKDGSTQRVGIGSAAVRVGRTVDVFAYSTTGDDLTDLLGPAIDASIARLRTALAGESAQHLNRARARVES